MLSGRMGRRVFLNWNWKERVFIYKKRTFAWGKGMCLLRLASRSTFPLLRERIVDERYWMEILRELVTSAFFGRFNFSTPSV